MSESDNEKALDDLRRLIKTTAALPGMERHGVRAYSDLGGYDEVNGDGDRTLINLVIGMRGSGIRFRSTRDLGYP